MTFEIFLFCLFLVSIFTGLGTEAMKVLLDYFNKQYHSNVLAGVVSIPVSAVVGSGYIILTNTAFTSQLGVYLVALIALGWIGAMIGYDKVIQTIKQCKTQGKE